MLSQDREKSIDRSMTKGPEPLSQTEVIVVILQKNMRFNCISIIYVTARCSNGKAVPTLGIT